MARHVGLHFEDFVRIHERQIVDTVDRGAAFDVVEKLDLRIVRGNDQFAAAFVLDPVAFAIGVHHVAAFDAEPRFVGILAVVDAGVDDLGIAGTGAGPDHIRAFENDDLVPRHGERPRRRQTDHTGADNDASNSIDHENSVRKV